LQSMFLAEVADVNVAAAGELRDEETCLAWILLGFESVQDKVAISCLAASLGSFGPSPLHQLRSSQSVIGTSVMNSPAALLISAMLAGEAPFT
jgi:hypothetical protein